MLRKHHLRLIIYVTTICVVVNIGLSLLSNAVSYTRFDDVSLRTEAKQMAAKAIASFDFDLVDSSKALLFHSLLECVFNKLDQTPSPDILEKDSTKFNLTFLGALDPGTLHILIKKLMNQVNSKISVISFLTQPIINEHNFSYIHNPKDACADDPINVLFVVPSAPTNFQRRENVRVSSRGRYVQNPQNKAKLLFFIGRPVENNEEVQDQIDEESEKYGDIVQESFVDVYRNITLKAMSMLKWTSTFCQQTNFVIRTDDDVEININKILKILRSKQRQFGDFVIGDKKVDWTPIRDESSRWYLSEKEYPYPFLPPFALGGLLAYPASTVTLLYHAAMRSKPIWLDDVFITGMCAPKVDVPLLGHSEFVFKHDAW
ncbi:beta-1,3-galactosyltransferase 5-like [Physella acuta]|uniref:beta-1,3-galactosyltransferase 5-like n=1 Tax=Physella acuta TaxID=109671 RepID=UPI0027DAC070|nr:beta-1,3-galactosyltransferase 5-like [Physella acuta]